MTEAIPYKTLHAQQLKVSVYASRMEMGAAAATEAAERINELLSTKDGLISVVFAAAPSQNEFLLHLSRNRTIDWSRIVAFHMDEYVGIDQDSPQRFSAFLRRSIFEKVPLHTVHYINAGANSADAECKRYTLLLKQYPPDIVCLGIGENTHIAFNDPYVADFNDPFLVKIVTLDQASREQQVNDGCFPDLSQVPTEAITLTVPALLQASSLFCIVPGKNKATAVCQTLYNEVNNATPSTSLREHPDARLYLDVDSASELNV
jgi:glucosamine-6-phosphate deaminase